MKPIVSSLLAAALLGLVPLAFAHGHDGGSDTMDMDMSMPGAGAEQPKPDPDSYAPTYFAHREHAGVMYAHIGVMVIAWVLVLPTAVMLSLARSRYTLALQFVFLVANALGLVLGTIYNAKTPDLYPGNAHHKLGWIVTWVLAAQVLIGLLGRVAGAMKGSDGQVPRGDEYQSFIPVSSAAAMAEHRLMNDRRFPQSYRLSNDSGQGTEPNTESLRSHSVSTTTDEPAPQPQDPEKEYDEEDVDLEDALPASTPSRSRYSPLLKISRLFSTRVWRILMLGYNLVDRVILILGFVAICTGIITYGRFFEGDQIFTGLAHWIKGGVFFWLGALTLGRWSGSFGEIGWAWNMRPKQAGRKWRPSAEFVESALIFFYGSTNIFLEHLANSGEDYSSQDLEHVSITILFIGGGLCGMLIESTRVRDLLNMTVTEAALTYPEHNYREDERESLQPPKQYEFSLNPIPALVILLLGIMMSSHTQQSMISSMVHKQWGNLLTGASFARAFTYVLMYLKPPQSILPSRPPTELLASFGLISGGIIFMASSGDTIDGMIHYDLDAMFMYTVTMGFVGLLMAWIVVLLAIKGWAVRKEAGRPASSYRFE